MSLSCNIGGRALNSFIASLAKEKHIVTVHLTTTQLQSGLYCLEYVKMALRAFGSALFRACNKHAVRPALRFGSPTSITFRAFATEAGYLDKNVVTERVLEVVRKFEKVRLRI